jgi:5-methylcytosine-specific restriction endonuclease McrA
MKTCSQCHLPKSLDSFYKNCRTKDGRRSACKECEGKDPKRLERKKRANKRYAAKHKVYIIIKDARYRKTHKQEILVRKRAWSKKDHQLHPEKKRRKRTLRRTRLKETIVEPISLEVLAERDHWTCHICKRKVTRKNWSHDHLIPIAVGGNTTYLNVALCHQRCNSKRGVGRLPAQLRLLP